MAKLKVADEHREYFREHKFIEFENLLTPNQLCELNGMIDASLSQRLKVPAHLLDKQSSELLYKAGSDLWRQNAFFKKLLCNKWWAEIAKELTRQKVIRMGTDQLLMAAGTPGHLAEEMFNKETLERCFSFQGLACGLLICLRSNNHSDEAKSISHEAGSGVFIDPTHHVDLSSIFNTPGERQLLILFGGDTLIYLHNAKDLNTHFAKSLGYVFGDKLKERTHPTLFR